MYIVHTLAYFNLIFSAIELDFSRAASALAPRHYSDYRHQQMLKKMHFHELSITHFAKVPEGDNRQLRLVTKIDLMT